MLLSVDEFSPTAARQGHVPVLLEETLEVLRPRAGARILDGTFGGGGHSRALLEAAEGVTVVALDCDPAALPRADALRAEYGDRFVFHAMNFGDLAGLEEGGFDGALFDFGLSSFQLDDGQRGFSFRNDAPADMRMNPSVGIPAAAYLETVEEASLIRAVRDYGEEKRWRRVVQSILEARGSGRLQRTRSLAELVEAAVGAPRPGRKSVHPATRTFQGIRIAVNDELNAIQQGLPAAFDRLSPGGVLAAISFHSLEDRIVKRFCRRMAGRPEHGKDSRPQEERVALAEMPFTRPRKPSETEMRQNPRSRSARMRTLRKPIAN